MLLSSLSAVLLRGGRQGLGLHAKSDSSLWCRVPSLFEQVFRGALSGQIRISLYNTIWIFVATCVSYGIGASLLGGSARLPIVADTADQRIP